MTSYQHSIATIGLSPRAGSGVVIRIDPLVICVFCLLVVLVRLSVPVQVIDWKDSSLK